MLFLIGFVVIILISFWLAYRSMKDYREHPPKKVEYGTFLVRTPHNFKPQILEFIASQAKLSKSLFSVEYLQKGSQKALILYIPKSLFSKLPMLHLLEIEDHLDKVKNENSAQEFHLASPASSLEVHSQVFSQIKLAPQDLFCFQVACQVIHPSSNLASKLQKNILLQIHPKAVLYSKSPMRSKMLSEINQLIEKSTNIKKSVNPHSSGQIHAHAQKRNLVPYEIEPFLATPEELVRLMYS